MVTEALARELELRAGLGVEVGPRWRDRASRLQSTSIAAAGVGLDCRAVPGEADPALRIGTAPLARSPPPTSRVEAGISRDEEFAMAGDGRVLGMVEVHHRRRLAALRIWPGPT